MKQYYESELIKEIAEARGHKKSSLHYESECVESWIEEAKGAYPKLCDYESEWLNYISILDDMGGGEDPEPPIGEFPYVVLSDVTEATVDNVVPYAYKSAILKGLTLVNVKGEESNDYPMNNYPKYDFLIPLAKKNTDYLIKYDTTLSGGLLAIGFLNNGASWSNNLEEQPNIGLIRLNSGEYPNYFRIVGGKGQTVRINNLMIIEYQEGMENWDIPYFEGMQTVKMPGLMTYSNLFTGFVASGYIGGDGNVVKMQGNILSDFIEIHEKTIAFRTFRGNGEPSTRYGEFAFYDNNKNFIARKIGSDTTNEYTTVPDGTKYVRIWTVPLDGLGLNTKGMMIYTKNKPSLAITKHLESNKTNILTVNEDVTLRSNGNVYDELDLLTGKLTQRIDEDGSVLTQEVVKTVELNIQDQDGKPLSAIKPIEGKMFLSTSSNTIKPLFSGEIPVEAITQNLASFIDLETGE